MPNEREPLVIDKETTFPVRYGTKTGVLILAPTYGMTDSILLSDCTGHVGSMRLEPDPAAAAVHAETERIRAEVGRCIWNEFSGPMSDNPRANSLIRDIDVAIDAPPEPVRTLTKQLGATEKERAFQVGQRNAADQLLRMKIEELAAAEAERNSAVIALALRAEALAACGAERGRLREACRLANSESEEIHVVADTMTPATFVTGIGVIVECAKRTKKALRAALEDKT